MLPRNNGAVTYAEWVDADTLEQSELYHRAMQWMLCGGTIDSLTHWSRSDGIVHGVGKLAINEVNTMAPTTVSYALCIKAVNGRYERVLGEFHVNQAGHGMDASSLVADESGRDASAVCIAIERHARALCAALDAYIAMRHR